MKEFYLDYAKQLLRIIFEEYKKGNIEKAREKALELKEINRELFFEKKLSK